MSTRAQTELHTEEMKKRKKRETDRRHRLNKKRAVQETEHKLAMAITENENLKRSLEEHRKQIFDLTSEKQLFEKRLETMYNELEKEIECVRVEADEGFGEKRGMAMGSGNSLHPSHVTRFSN